MSKPKVVTEFEDLYALGPGTVVRDAEGWVWENVKGEWRHIRYGMTNYLNAACVPATVLYEPEARAVIPPEVVEAEADLDIFFASDEQRRIFIELLESERAEQ